jgi:hypothetical protein
MNVLILTPDAVGGTLLETTLAMYMQSQNFDQPVISVKDLALGVKTHYQPELDKTILQRLGENEFQSLPDLVNTLSSVDHYTVAKLTNYIMRRRNDSQKDQNILYNYLNDNFYIITCRRDNLFEHALSWGINMVSKTLNVYDHQTKIKNFGYMYANGITLDPLALVNNLNNYKDYLSWCNTHFKVSSYYCYEKHATDLESYILNLPIFSQTQSPRGWNDIYGISFNDWNKCHYQHSNIGSLALERSNEFKLLLQQNNIVLEESAKDRNFDDSQTIWNNFSRVYQEIADETWPRIESLEDYQQLPDHIREECENGGILYFLNQLKINENLKKSANSSLEKLKISSKSDVTPILDSISALHQQFLTKHQAKYQTVMSDIEHKITLGMLPCSIPIKKQTLTEKAIIVKNFAECLDTYNHWAIQNSNIAPVIDQDQIVNRAIEENSFWVDKPLMPMIQ